MAREGERKFLQRRKGTSSKSAARKSRRAMIRRTLCLCFTMLFSSTVGFASYMLWYMSAIQRTQHDHVDTPAQVAERPGAAIRSQKHGSFKSPYNPAITDHVAESPTSYESPLIIFTCSRADYLRTTLQFIEKALMMSNDDPEGHICVFGCPIVISQDGNNAPVTAVIKEFQTRWDDINLPLVHLRHTPTDVSRLRGFAKSYTALAQHYGWALRKVFGEPMALSSISSFPAPQRLIIMEEDIQVAPDFFSYFEAMAPILDNDRSLFAVSAFNDNGQHKPKADVITPDTTSWSSPAQAHLRVLRSDFFPGLGWMMTRSLWKDELESKWPKAYWDDWLREPAQRMGRQVLRPEVGRTYHFGSKGGASKNQFGALLQNIQLNDRIVDWKQQDLSYLDADVYKEMYMKLVMDAQVARTSPELLVKVISGNVRLEYKSFGHFKKIASSINIMNDEKAGIPRTAYNGVVETRPKGNHIAFLVPSSDGLI